MRKTQFRVACECYDQIAGPDDWEVFAVQFDDAIGELTAEELDVVGVVVERLKLARSAVSPELVISSAEVDRDVRERLVKLIHGVA